VLVAIEFTAPAVGFDCPGVVAIEQDTPFGMGTAIFGGTTVVIPWVDFRHIKAARYVADHFVVFTNLQERITHGHSLTDLIARRHTALFGMLFTKTGVSVVVGRVSRHCFAVTVLTLAGVLMFAAVSFVSIAGYAAEFGLFAVRVAALLGMIGAIAWFVLLEDGVGY